MYQQEAYSTLVVLSHKDHSCVDVAKLKDKFPLLLLTEHQTFLLKEVINNHFLVVVCMKNWGNQNQRPQNKVILNTLSQNIHQKRSSHIILRFARNGTNNTALYDIPYLNEIFQYCQDQHMSHVVALHQNFPLQYNIYYTFLIFPRIQVKSIHYNKNNSNGVYDKDRNKLNHFGYSLRTIHDEKPFNTLLYNDPTGQLRLAGYLGTFIHYIAQYLNATLELSDLTKRGQTVSYTEISALLNNKSIDIPASTFFRCIDKYKSYSYPIFVTKPCLLIPIEAKLTVRESLLKLILSYTTLYLIGLYSVFAILLHLVRFKYKQTNHMFKYQLPDIVIHEQVFRGLLGQSFPFNFTNVNWLTVFITSNLLLTGYIFSTFHQASLQTYLTRPPYKARIRNMDDFVKSPNKILIPKQIYDTINSKLKQFAEKCTFSKSMEEYQKALLGLNDNFTYIIPSWQWPLINSMQSSFPRPIFRFNRELCETSIPLSIPLEENSVYEEVIKEMVLQLQAFGLFELWMRNSYYDYTAHNHIPHEKLEYKKQEQLSALKLEDIDLIFYFLLCSCLLSILVLIMEICISRDTLKNL
ncbi:uncharacterized protein LOC119675611 [Teleopsis dalmanni]|uniref:uncharacterized protein LOC119675611 n=1 Tax=Teleopsis dalmanni TaxID=139649 RepID=UPI0018CFD90D|nr:uncharacterized protein LOC119675611 [Teleopsis dalmanni]